MRIVSKRVLKSFLPLVVVGALAMTVACQDGADADHRQSRKAAENAYELLIKGKYEAYVDQIYYADSLTDSYRQQLIDRMKEFMQKEAEARGGIVSATATYDTLFSSNNSAFPLQAHVFLELTFGDGSHHEVGVPMVKVDGKWKMQ